tara:strand:+ start:1101 stop:1703 length:603 start_codon:yes stop_codon:yes gene_type:complete
MTLATSGIMSIGGTTNDRSINVELGRSATATSNMGETDLRTLAGVPSGSISMSNFYGQSNYDWVVTVTNANATIFGQAFQGYGSIGNPSSPSTFGSATDSTCDLYSTNPTWAWYAVNNGTTIFYIYDGSGTPTGNAGWTSLDIYLGQTGTSGSPSITRTRSSLTYASSGSSLRYWDMADGGQTNGAFSSPTNSPVTLAFK